MSCILGVSTQEGPGRVGAAAGKGGSGTLAGRFCGLFGQEGASVWLSLRNSKLGREVGGRREEAGKREWRGEEAGTDETPGTVLT